MTPPTFLYKVLQKIVASDIAKTLCVICFALLYLYMEGRNEVAFNRI